VLVVPVTVAHQVVVVLGSENMSVMVLLGITQSVQVVEPGIRDLLTSVPDVIKPYNSTYTTHKTIME
jgi:hypothetical protein